MNCKPQGHPLMFFCRYICLYWILFLGYAWTAYSSCLSSRLKVLHLELCMLSVHYLRQCFSLFVFAKWWNDSWGQRHCCTWYSLAFPPHIEARSWFNLCDWSSPHFSVPSSTFWNMEYAL